MRLLAIRTSAMGDVALTAPVLQLLRIQYPYLEIIMVTRREFSPFFASIEGIKLFYPDLENRHKGLTGIIRLYRDLGKFGKFDHVADLHDVLRSKILSLLFRLSGVPVCIIDKGRKERKDLISGKNKIQLRHSTDRYRDVFERCGLPVTPAKEMIITPSAASLLKATRLIRPSKELNIGVAPFAKHKLKMWPEEYMVQLLQLIAGKRNVKFWLFGGADESARIDKMCSGIAGSQNLAGRLSLDDELGIMNRLDFMIAMDSSNMHMAALSGTKVISIWGGTDPMAGFGALNQPDNYSIRIPVEELTCRPCTIFGKGECSRGDFACMLTLKPSDVFRKIEELGLV